MRLRSNDYSGSVSESVSITIVDPSIILRKTLEEKRWFEGVVLSTTYFEHYGFEKLKNHFKGVINEKKLEYLGFESKLVLMFGSGVINQTTLLQND